MGQLAGSGALAIQGPDPLARHAPAGPAMTAAGVVEDRRSAIALPAPGETLLEVEGLRVWFPVGGGLFGKKGQNVRAVEDVSFSLRRGEVVGLVGESGSGKTTVGRSILRLTEAT